MVKILRLGVWLAQVCVLTLPTALNKLLNSLSFSFLFLLCKMGTRQLSSLVAHDRKRRTYARKGNVLKLIFVLSQCQKEAEQSGLVMNRNPATLHHRQLARMTPPCFPSWCHSGRLESSGHTWAGRKGRDSPSWTKWKGAGEVTQRKNCSAVFKKGESKDRFTTEIKKRIVLQRLFRIKSCNAFKMLSTMSDIQ